MLEPTRSDPRRSRLAVHLATLDDDDVSGAAVRWQNAGSREDHPESAAAIDLHLRERAAAIGNEELASQVGYELDSAILKARVRADELAGEADAELARWKEAHGAIRAYELYLLFLPHEENCPAALLEEANRLLEDVGIASSSEMMLASAFLGVTVEDAEAARSAFEEGRGRAIAVLEDNIEEMEGTSGVSNSLTKLIYARLYKFTGNEKYRSRFAYWHALDEAHAAVERSESLVAAGRYFEDFRGWVNAFRGYGLAVDSGDDLAESPDQRRARSQAWLAEGADPVQPLLRAGDGVVVSSRFLLDGQAILSTGAGDSPDVAAARERFNALAGAALPRLRAEVTRLPDLPAELREMLVRYDQRLHEYSPAG
jgi:hypothetical protein